ncbi:sialate O-acetylesterase [Methylobacterium sp. WL30]|nr:sialate O-acetylesterase [Methylobacterium sp. WL30]
MILRTQRTGPRRARRLGVSALVGLALASPATAGVCRPTDRGRGTDVVLLAGQSNMVGFGLGFDAALDGTPDPRIGQWSQAGGRGRIVAAIDPLLHPGAAAGRVGLGLSFARAYIAARPPGRRILLVPAAVGGTGFANGRWNPGDDLFEAAVMRTNAALAAAPNACLAAILWHQGEADVGALSGSDYAARLTRTVAAFRARIGGARNAPFVTGRFEPEWVKPTPAQTAILDALAHLADTVPRTVDVSADGLTGNPGDKIHFDAASQRILGRRYFEALRTLLPAPRAAKP